MFVIPKITPVCMFCLYFFPGLHYYYYYFFFYSRMVQEKEQQQELMDNTGEQDCVQEILLHQDAQGELG